VCVLALFVSMSELTNASIVVCNSCFIMLNQSMSNTSERIFSYSLVIAIYKFFF
jgi:hypothetical protein